MKSVVRWNPMTSVQDELNRVMDDVFGRRWRTDEAGAVLWQPPIDIEEGAASYKVHLELPGMRLEDIKITLEATASSACTERSSGRSRCRTRSSPTRSKRRTGTAFWK